MLETTRKTSTGAPGQAPGDSYPCHQDPVAPVAPGALGVEPVDLELSVRSPEHLATYSQGFWLRIWRKLREKMGKKSNWCKITWFGNVWNIQQRKIMV